MGPEPGTEQYKKQVESICNVISSASFKTPEEIDRALILYILDEDYNRAAICEARKILLGDKKCV